MIPVESGLGEQFEGHKRLLNGVTLNDVKWREANLQHISTYPARRQELRVFVKDTAVHSSSRQRIPGIVLKYERKATAANHPTQFPQQRRMLLTRYVMEHAGSESDIDAGIC